MKPVFPSKREQDLLVALRRNNSAPFSRQNLDHGPFRKGAFLPHSVSRSGARELIRAALVAGLLIEKDWPPYREFKQLAFPN